MHGRDFSGFDYAKHYPSKSKRFHNWGIGPITAIYPPGTIPQVADSSSFAIEFLTWNVKFVSIFLAVVGLAWVRRSANVQDES